MLGSHEALSHRTVTVRTKIVRTRDLTHGLNKEPQGLYAKNTVARAPWIARSFDRITATGFRWITAGKTPVENRTVTA